MWISGVYNHQHKFAHLSLLSRNLYWFPAFLISAFTNQLFFHVLMIVFYLGLAKSVCKIKTLNILKLLAYPLLFITIGCLTFLVSFQSTSPWFKISQYSLGYYADGFKTAQLIFFRSFAIVCTIYFSLLINTISEIAEILKTFKVPSVFIELFVITYKFIENLLYTSSQLYLAQRCRHAYANNGNKIKQFAMLVAATFQVALNQTKQVELSIESRAFNGKYVFLNKEKTNSWHQFIKPTIVSFSVFVSYLIISRYGL